MVEELKLAIKVDDDSIEQSLLKQFANAQKMADKVVLDFKNVNFDDKEIEAKFKALQKKAGQNPIDLSINKDSIQMLSQISDKLGDIFKIAQGKSIIDSSSTNADIGKIENKLNELVKKYEDLQKKASGGISGKEVNLVDNDEFKKLSQEVSELKGQFDDLKTHMSLLDDYTVPTDRFFELQTQVEATSVKVSDLVDEMTRLSNVQKNLGAETNISLGDNGIREQTKEISLLKDKAGELLTVYRGVYDAYNGLTSKRYGGKTFLTAGYDLSKEYAQTKYNDGKSKIYKANLALENPLEFDAHSSSWNKLDLNQISELKDYLVKKQIELSKAITDFYKSIQNIENVDAKNILKSVLDNIQLKTNDHFENNNFDMLNLSTGESLGDATYFEQYFETIFSNVPYIIENEINDIDLSKAKELLKSKLQELYTIQKSMADNMLVLEGDYVNDSIPVYFEKAYDYYTDEIIHLAEKAGFDSVIFKNIKDGSNNDEDVFAVFNDNQIKNAELVDLKVEKLKSDYQELLDMIETSKYLGGDGSLENAIKTNVEEYLSASEEEFGMYSSFIDKAILNGKIEPIQYDLISFDPETGEQKYKEKEGEVERFTNDLIKYAEEIQTQYNRIINPDTISTSTVDTQDKLQSELKETELQAEKTVQAVKEVSSATPEKDLKDAFQGSDEITSSSEKVSNAIKEENNILEQNTQKAKENAEAKEKMANADKEVSNTNFSKYDNRLESYNKKTSGYDATIARFEDGGWTSDAYLKKVQAVKDAVAEYERILNNLKDHPELVTEEGLNDLAKQEKLIKENITAVQNMSAAEKGFTLLSGQKAMDKINSILKENSAMSKQAKNQIRAWYNEIASGNPSKNLSQILGEVQKIVNAEAEAGRTGKSMWDIFKDKSLYGGIARLAQYYLSFTDIIRYGRQAISTIVELDDALVDLKKTTSMSSSELENFYYDANDVAKQMGVTTEEIINQASAWSRLNKIGLLYGDI